MKLPFVFKRFFQAFLVVGAGLFLVYLMRGRTVPMAAIEAGIWGLISAVIFAGTVAYNMKRNSACLMCKENQD